MYIEALASVGETRLRGAMVGRRAWGEARERERGGDEGGAVDWGGCAGGVGERGGAEGEGGGKARAGQAHRSSDQQLATTTTQMAAPQAGIT